MKDPDLTFVIPTYRLRKEQFLTHLATRLRDKKLGALVKSLFRPSYGGNRNCTLMYTLGELMVSSDDDMRPYALMDTHPESLADHEIAHGKLVKAGRDRVVRKSFDMLTALLEVWPTLVEICFFEKSRRGLPQALVANQRLR